MNKHPAHGNANAYVITLLLAAKATKLALVPQRWSFAQNVNLRLRGLYQGLLDSVFSEALLVPFAHAVRSHVIA